MLGIDTSFYDVSLDKARQLRADGIEVAWQCLHTGARQPPPRVTNLRNYMNAGMIVLGYASLPTGATTGAWLMDAARAGVPEDIWAALVRVVTDVELPGITEVAIRQAVDRSFDLSGKRRTIYSSFNAFCNLVVPRNPLSFAGDCDIINAFWRNSGVVPADAAADFNAYPWGGFTADQVIAEQYTGDLPLEGIDLDRDVYFIDRARLLGQTTTAVVDASTGLLVLRIGILETGMKALLTSDGQSLLNVGKLLGGK